jgi:spoIIIJ-associated protein
MEWVETTGKTVAEAKDRALDQLGVDEHDAEFEIVSEPRPGFLGRLRGEARVRARVRPTRPRPKVDRRDRRRPRRGGSGGERRQAERAGGSRTAAPPRAASEAGAATITDGPSGSPPRKRRRRGSGGGGGGAAAKKGEARTDEGSSVTEIDLVQQEELVSDFLHGLVDAFGVEAEVSTAVVVDDEAVEATVDGTELGLLVGPKGVTLSAIQELARSVVQRQMPGERHGRIRLDVAGYRERRRVALERFARQVAEDVLASGTQKALEPMPPPDRKVIHDAINGERSRGGGS